MKTKKGFTLIELLVVVLIIGILAAIAVPQYQKAVLKSRLSNLKTLVSNVVRAQEIYFLSNNKYTSNREDLEIDLPAPLEFETDGNNSFLIYDWGIFRININMAKGKDINAGIQYGQYFVNVDYYLRAGKRECCAKTDSSVANSVCQNDSGSNEAFWEGEDTSVGYSISCYSYD